MKHCFSLATSRGKYKEGVVQGTPSPGRAMCDAYELLLDQDDLVGLLGDVEWAAPHHRDRHIRRHSVYPGEFAPVLVPTRGSTASRSMQIALMKVSKPVARNFLSTTSLTCPNAFQTSGDSCLHGIRREATSRANPSRACGHPPPSTDLAAPASSSPQATLHGRRRPPANPPGRPPIASTSAHLQPCKGWCCWRVCSTNSPCRAAARRYSRMLS